MTRLLFTIFVLVSLLPRASLASFIYVPRTPRSTGMAGSDIILEGGSIFTSPAVLVEHGVGFMSGFSKPFGLPGVGLEWVQGSVGNRFLSGGVGVGRLSAEGYEELTWILSFAMRRERGEAVGLSFKVMEARTGYGEREGTFALDCGMRKEWKRILAGISLRNINYPEPQYLSPPPEVIVGVGKEFGDEIVAAFEVEREIGRRFEPRIGIETRVSQGLFLRGGLFLEPTRIASGIGVSVRKMRFDYSYLTHEELGGTHDFSLGMIW